MKYWASKTNWNTERVGEDASGDSEDGEDDELPCVIGESAGDCVWRGSRRSVEYKNTVHTNLKPKLAGRSSSQAAR